MGECGCLHVARPGKFHPEVRLHNFLCINPLKVNVNPLDCSGFLNIIDWNQPVFSRVYL